MLLTALTQVSNKVEAFNAGADDYLTKPFSFIELLARVNAVKRRYDIGLEQMEYDIISVDLLNRNVDTNSGKRIELTDKEFELLKYFIQNKGEVLDREKLCKNVWGLNFTPKTNICDAAVKNLRKKLEESTGKKYIKTLYGEGYILIAD